MRCPHYFKGCLAADFLFANFVSFILNAQFSTSNGDTPAHGERSKNTAHSRRVSANALFWTTRRRQADFFCGKRNGITFPYSSGFVAFFLKLTGTKNSMISAINHLTS
jgi:hypothetical protein